MAKRLKPSDIHNSGDYKLVKELHHDEVIEFVMSQVRQLRWPMILFYGFNILLLLMMAVFSIGNLIHSYISWSLYWQFLLLGIVAGMLLVIPFHELIHGLAYKLTGAPKVKYGADLKQMMFYASAPDFVAGKGSFYVIAFSPFLIINIFFLSVIILGSDAMHWGALTAIFIHSTMCIGDFAMVNFFTKYPGKQVYTFDEGDSRKSYFYLKID